MNLSMIIQNTKLILTNDFTDCNDDKTRNNNLSAGNIYLAEELNLTSWFLHQLESWHIYLRS